MIASEIDKKARKHNVNIKRDDVAHTDNERHPTKKKQQQQQQ